MAKKPIPQKQPIALACALIEDGKRHLFLASLDLAQKPRYELPSILIYENEDAVSALRQAILSQCEIDAQVHEIILKGKYNIGSKKRRHLIPVLGFSASAKNMSAKPAKPFVGIKWMGAKESLLSNLGRKSAWLMRAEIVS